MSNDWVTGHAWRDGVYLGLMNARQETWAENGWVEGEKPAPDPAKVLAAQVAAIDAERMRRIEQGRAFAVPNIADPIPLTGRAFDQSVYLALLMRAQGAAAAKSLGIASITSLSSSRNLTSADAGKLLTSSLSTAVAVTIPTDATAGWTDTLAVSLAQLGTGVLSVAAGSGVSLNGVANGSTEIQQRYGLCQLVRLGTDEWLVFGLTDEVTE